MYYLDKYGYPIERAISKKRWKNFFLTINYYIRIFIRAKKVVRIKPNFVELKPCSGATTGTSIYCQHNKSIKECHICNPKSYG